MSNTFVVQCDWLRPDPGDDAGFDMQAQLTIWVNDECVTTFEDRSSGDIDHSPGLSADWLATWFAVNWWRLRWEPDRSPSFDWEMSHNLAAAGGGYLWPVLRFRSDGDTVAVESTATPLGYREPIRYLKEHSWIIDSAVFEHGIDQFIGATVERTSRYCKGEATLQELWAEVNGERRDAERYALRKLEACLGYDPAEAPEGLIEALQRACIYYGPDAVHELAAATQDQAVDGLKKLKDRILNSQSVVSLGNYEKLLRICNKEINQTDVPWRRAAQAARIARSVWGLPSGPVSTSTMSDLFGVPLSQSLVNDSPASIELRSLSAGLRENEDASTFRVSLGQRRETGRRFTLSRLVGDSLMAAPDEALLPSTQAKTSRQKFQRAFAQEFLCPIDDLREYLYFRDSPSDEDIDDAADFFKVSPLTVRATLVNKGILPRETLSEWLI